MTRRVNGKCKYGHSLEDAYLEKDPYGVERKRCKTCHLKRVKAYQSKPKPSIRIQGPDGKIFNF